MYFSAEHNQLHTTPPCYILFQQEMAQMTQQKTGTSNKLHRSLQTGNSPTVTCLHVQKSLPQCGLYNSTKGRHILSENGSNNAAKKRAPPPIDNAHPTRNRKQRETHQVYMYFSAEHTQLRTTPPRYVSFQQEMAQMTPPKNGHLIQVTPLTANRKQPDSHVFTCTKVLTAMWDKLPITNHNRSRKHIIEV